MAGAIVLVVILVLFPLVVSVGSAVVAAVLGILLKQDADASHPDSEYLELNR